MAPINPGVEGKQIVVDVTDSRQTLSCYEGKSEVYYCRISSGRVPNTTPLSAYDLSWISYMEKIAFNPDGRGIKSSWLDDSWYRLGNILPGGSGIAIHSTFWHNNFGEASSHGCINAAPEDAKWIFRWATPETPFEEGDITVTGTIGTPVKVIEY